MAIEIEKKYKLDEKALAEITRRLAELNAEFAGDSFEENFLHSGGGLDEKSATLRLRTAGSRTILTYKEKVRTEGDIKHKLEFETGIEDRDAMEKILKGLGFRPSVVYEKYRKKWDLSDVEVVLDQLPFGIYMEIEGTAEGIKKAENALGASKLEPEMLSYPRLTLRYGKEKDGVIESRFEKRSSID